MTLRKVFKGEGVPSPLAQPLLVAFYDTQGYGGTILYDVLCPNPQGILYSSFPY